MTGIVVQVPGQPPRVFHDGFTIGRAGRGADFEVDDEYASPGHAKCTPLGGVWVIEDLGSTNGTHVNGIRTYRQFLSGGDKVRVGKTVLIVVPT